MSKEDQIDEIRSALLERVDGLLGSTDDVQGASNADLLGFAHLFVAREQLDLLKEIRDLLLEEKDDREQRSSSLDYGVHSVSPEPEKNHLTEKVAGLIKDRLDFQAETKSETTVVPVDKGAPIPKGSDKTNPSDDLGKGSDK